MNTFEDKLFDEARERVIELLEKEIITDPSFSKGEDTPTAFRRLTGEKFETLVFVDAACKAKFGYDKSGIESGVIFAWLGRRQALKEIAEKQATESKGAASNAQ